MKELAGRPFDNGVAGTAIANQVAKAVGLCVSLTKLPKGNDVVNIKFAGQVGFNNAAPLAGVIVTFSGPAPLLRPVGTVEGKVSALPGGMISRIVSDVFVPAFNRAKSTFLSILLRELRRHGETLPTVYAHLCGVFNAPIAPTKIPLADCRSDRFLLRGVKGISCVRALAFIRAGYTWIARSGEKGTSANDTDSIFLESCQMPLLETLTRAEAPLAGGERLFPKKFLTAFFTSCRNKHATHVSLYKNTCSNYTLVTDMMQVVIIEGYNGF